MHTSKRELTKPRPDIDSFWMPFTANRQFKSTPRMLVSAQGMYYRSSDGRCILDATSGLWCVNAGHAQKKITEAVGKQLETLDFGPTFQMGHPMAFNFARMLSEVAPGGNGTPLNKIFFTGSGSESVDTALKMAVAYQNAVGKGNKTRLIGRERAYHGVGFGGLSVGGILGNRQYFPQLPSVSHIRHTHDLVRNAFSQGLPKHGAELADDLERLIALHGAETIAAVIIEPVAGSTGVLIPPEGYLEKIKEICVKNDILLIFDEVITGFGRLGTRFATDYFGVIPDLVCTAKGLTNGAIPMGAVFAHHKIYDAIMEKDEHQIEFSHGYTYSGHPVACAAGIATLELFREENLLQHASSMLEIWQKTIGDLKQHPYVRDIRIIGLIAGIELETRADGVGRRAYDLFVDCFERGLLVRVTGDIIALSPPLILNTQHIDSIARILGDALRNLR